MHSNSWFMAVVLSTPALGAQQLDFEPNVGQADEHVLFVERGPGHTLFLTAEGATFAIPDAAVRMRFRGRSETCAVAGAKETGGRSNYLMGSDPSKWLYDVPRHAGVRYSGVYEGIDAHFHGDSSRLELDFELDPGADAADIRLVFEGHTRLELDAEGRMLVHSGALPLPFSCPVAFQTIDGERDEVPVRYRIHPDGSVGFELGAYDHSRSLVIDPVLLYSSFLGGAGLDIGSGVAQFAGQTYVSGYTSSLDFPVQGALQSELTGIDVFVARLDSDGEGILYATYLGGGSVDFATDLAVDAFGNVLVTGRTESDDFPLTDPLQPELGGGSDAFVTKLTPEGLRIVYSTYLGGLEFDNATAIAVDRAGRAHVCGGTQSSDFPTQHALQQEFGGGSPFGAGDAFLTGIEPDGSLYFSTFYGGLGGDEARDVALDVHGGILLVGRTDSDDFPTVVPMQAERGGSLDAFVVRLAPKAASVVYSTYLGGELRDFGSGVAFDGLGRACLTGDTSSPDFPLELPLQPEIRGPCDAFVTILDTSGELAFSTVLGSTSLDFGLRIDVDPWDSLVIVGSAFAGNFPTRMAAQRHFGGGGDGFVLRLTPGGGTLAFASYLGGSGFEIAADVAVDSLGTATVVGYTHSQLDFPLMRPFQRRFGGDSNDAFVTRMCTRPGLCPSRPFRAAAPPKDGAPVDEALYSAFLELLAAGRSPLDPPRPD